MEDWSINPRFQSAEIAHEHQRNSVAGDLDTVADTRLLVEAGGEKCLIVLKSGLRMQSKAN